MPLSNASRLADFGTGIGTAGAIIQVDNANQRLGVGTTAPTATLGVAGIVSATAFYGDGSNLDGVASAGLGTALSETEFDPLTVIYQTSDTLSVGATITVDPPDATTKVAYTQYADIKLEDDADLIIADGDDFIPDILGLSTEGFSFSNANGNGIFDTVYTDNIENAAGRGAPNFPLGITVTGISTLSGNVSIGGTLTYEDVTNVDSVGMVTARNGIEVIAGGANIVGVVTASTGIDAASNLILKTGGSERLRIDGNGRVLIGTDATRQTRVGGSNFSGLVQVESDSEMGFTIGRFNNTAGGPRFVLQKARGTGASPAIVQEDDLCGQFLFSGWDGDTFTNLAKINVDVDGTPGDDDMPGRIEFHTTPDGSKTPTERLRIGSSGQIGIAGANYGTSGQVLTSGGASAAPQWADAGGVWSLINNNKVTTNVSAIDVSLGANAGITTSYAQIKVYYNIWLASGDKLYVRGAYGFNGSVGADIKTSDYWYSGYWHRAGDGGMNQVTRGENLGYALISADNNKTQHSGEMIFDNSAGRMRVSGSASWPAMVYNCQGFSGGDNDAHNFTISGQLKGGDNSPMSGFRIFSGGPSIVSGEVRTYGLSAT